jgi:hypothetical protein
VSFQDETTGQLIDLNGASNYSYDSNGTVSSPEVRFFTLTVSSIPQNAPSVPTGLVSRIGIFHRSYFNSILSHSIILQWKANSETDLAGYNVWRSKSSKNGYVRLNAAPFLKSLFTDNQVKTGTTYYYVVTAVGKNGCESGFSQEAVGTAGHPTRR